MQAVGIFEKVDFEQFAKDWQNTFHHTNDEIKSIYNMIKLPTRATKGSAGYDFFAPIDFSLQPKQNILLPTGIRVKIDEGWFLAIMPKSGLGFKYRLQIDNTIGIIDSDYYYSDNQGHIFVKITNDSNNNKILSLNAQSSFCQGIFLPFGITYNDDVNTVRNGGLGSTSK